jgi:hypothetical protein
MISGAGPLNFMASAQQAAADCINSMLMCGLGKGDNIAIRYFQARTTGGNAQHSVPHKEMRLGTNLTTGLLPVATAAAAAGLPALLAASTSSGRTCTVYSEQFC